MDNETLSKYRAEVIEKFINIDNPKVQDLNMLNTVRNIFTHHNQEIFEVTDREKEDGKIIDPRNIEKGIDFEKLHTEFMNKAGGVEEYLAKVFQDLGEYY